MACHLVLEPAASNGRVAWRNPDKVAEARTRISFAGIKMNQTPCARAEGFLTCCGQLLRLLQCGTQLVGQTSHCVYFCWVALPAFAGHLYLVVPRHAAYVGSPARHGVAIYPHTLACSGRPALYHEFIRCQDQTVKASRSVLSIGSMCNMYLECGQVAAVWAWKLSALLSPEGLETRVLSSTDAT